MRRKRNVRFVQVKPACTLRPGLAAVAVFRVPSSPELLLNKVTDVDDKSHSRMLFVTPELPLMPAHSRRLFRRPAIAANPCCL